MGTCRDVFFPTDHRWAFSMVQLRWDMWLWFLARISETFTKNYIGLGMGTNSMAKLVALWGLLWFPEEKQVHNIQV